MSCSIYTYIYLLKYSKYYYHFSALPPLQKREIVLLSWIVFVTGLGVRSP